MSTNELDYAPVECRICHSKTTRDLILSPCLCKGSMGCVHIRCLEQWLNFSSHNFCELCSYRFEVIQVRRYSLLRSIRVYICQDQGPLYKAIFFVIISATNSILLCWMWFLWLSNLPIAFIKENKENTGLPAQKNNDLTKPKWIAVFVFLTLLTIFSVKSLCVDGFKAVKSQYNTWYRFWNETVNVQLVLDLENYKIRNKLEDFKDISLMYDKEKKCFPIQNTPGKTLEFQDVNEGSLKILFEMPDTHNSRHLSIDCGVDSHILVNNIEVKTSTYDLENSNSQDNLEYKHTQKINETAVQSKSMDRLYCIVSANQSSEDFPKVHIQKKTEQE